MLLFLFSTAVVFSVTNAADFHYMMQYESDCSQTSPLHLECVGKASSQDISVLVDSNSAVQYQVQPVIGSYSTWLYSIVLNGDPDLGIEHGNFSFGTHLAREHTFQYSSATMHVEPNTGLAEIYTTTTANITGGSGAFQGASGFLAYTCVSDETYSQSTCSVTVIANQNSLRKRNKNATTA
eukprot:m.335933 g.335933  ORF g.335933 m.335933 type:complete len:181 (-) comp17712_c0_seq1:42-584(-)